MSPADRKFHSPSVYPVWQRKLARLFDKAWVELSIGALIVASVILTLVEFGLSANPGHETSVAYGAVHMANQLVTGIFVVELALRCLALMSLRRFVREYWIDVVAVLPAVLPELFAARLMRLVRLLRILRLFGFLSRVSSNFPYIVRRGLIEYVTVCGLLMLTVLVATGAMTLFEGRHGPADRMDGGMSVGEAFWFSVYSLFAGEPVPQSPRTLGGKMVAVGVMFMGVTIFAMFTGTVTAFMVERIRTKGRTVDWDKLSDHIIICGWSSKAEIVLEEHGVSHAIDDTPVVVIAQWENEPPVLSPALQPRVIFVEDDFTKVSALEKAGIRRARTCILLSDTSGGRTEQDADARTIMAALTVEKLNPDVYTCAELQNSQYGSHLTMGNVNDYVVSSEYSAYLLAQAAMHRGLMGVFNELLTFKRGNQFYRIALPEEWHGKPFDELLVALRHSHGALLVAIYRADGMVMVNPSDYEFEAGDEIVVIADHGFEL